MPYAEGEPCDRRRFYESYADVCIAAVAAANVGRAHHTHSRYPLLSAFSLLRMARTGDYSIVTLNREKERKAW